MIVQGPFAHLSTRACPFSEQVFRPPSGSTYLAPGQPLQGVHHLTERRTKLVLGSLRILVAMHLIATQQIDSQVKIFMDYQAAILSFEHPSLCRPGQYLLGSFRHSLCKILRSRSLYTDGYQGTWVLKEMNSQIENRS